MLLSMSNVKKKYGSFALECSLKLERGQVTGLIGTNGAGKSTTFKLIMGLIFPDSGEITVLDKPVNKLSSSDFEKIGVVLSQSGFSGQLKVKDLIPIMQSMYRDFSKDDFLKKCERFAIPLDKNIKNFSTGMKAKLNVLLALSHNAELLILDEPTAGLDVIMREELLDMLREYMETGDKSILISSHISSDLEGLCDNLYMINDGKIIMQEETDVLLSDYGLLKLTEGQYDKLDKQYLIKVRKESYGYKCLTNQKQFYLENYPDISIEKGNIDEFITMMIRGGAA